MTKGRCLTRRPAQNPFMENMEMITAFAFRPFVLSGLLVMSLLAASPVFAAEEGVMAIVNGKRIMQKDVDAATKALMHDMSAAAGMKVDQVRPLVLEQFIDEKLIDDAINAAKIDDTKEYKDRVAIMEAQLKKQIYVERFLKSKVNNAAIGAEYAKFARENKGKREVRARHILVGSEKEANEIIQQLDKGADFGELARKRSNGPTAARGGDLGYFVEEEMVPEFSKAAFALKPGAYTKKPVKTQFGWHVIKSEDRRDRKVPTEKEVEDAIRSKLSQDAIQDLVVDLRKKASIQRFDEDGNPVKPSKPADEKKKK